MALASARECRPSVAGAISGSSRRIAAAKLARTSACWLTLRSGVTSLVRLAGCGEEPTIQTYEAALPAAYPWPESERREVTHEAGGTKWVWEVPAGWVDAPEVSELLTADYRFKGSSESLPGRLTVSMIEGDAGGVDTNVRRWLQQMYITTVRGPGPGDMVSEPMRVPYGFATFVELAGQYQGEHMPTHLYAAIVQIPAQEGGVYQSWFFKLAGDAATIDSNRRKMLRMVLSFRPEGAEAPNLPDAIAPEGDGRAQDSEGAE